jgi:rhodanese-related sulfurtransferase
MKEAKSISKSELKKLILNEQKVVIFDVRSPKEYETQHIPNAINVTIEQLENSNFTIENELLAVTVCGKGGGRSESAANYIQSNYSNTVYFLDGGTFGWFDESLK